MSDNTLRCADCEEPFTGIRPCRTGGQCHLLAAPYEPAATPAAPHPDDLAVDRFAAAMKAKLAQKRADGYGGWEDKKACPPGRLTRFLRAHLDKGDPVDIGNFAMMLWNRGERT